MTLNQITAWDQETLAETDAHLASMMGRLKEILRDPHLCDATFAEVAAIYNNAAYIFLYLESNEAHVRYNELSSWRLAFFGDSKLTQALTVAISSFRSSDPDCEAARQKYADQLRRPAVLNDSTTAQASELQTVAKGVLEKMRADQTALLCKLGVVGHRNPVSTFYRLVSTKEDVVVRAKLGMVWQKVREEHTTALLDVIDQQVALRRNTCAAAGYPSVLAHTLERCRVAEDEIAQYLDRCLRGAIASHAALEGEIEKLTGSVDRPIDHFGYYVQKLTGRRTVPLFNLGRCLDFLNEIAHTAFNLELTRVECASPHVMTYDVSDGQKHVGTINFDLWQSGKRPVNQTIGIRNRLEYAGVTQNPVAYVSCKFESKERDGGNITFQNVHSLFHEFGHAINHLLIVKRLPNQSGLEYLPLERIETLSMWFEKWVYHPDIAKAFGFVDEKRHGLILCQQVKCLEYRRTHLERAVTAMIDFKLHRHPSIHIAKLYAELDEEYKLAQHCTLVDCAPSFTWPMFQSQPGANFAYLWGAADSAERFIPMMSCSISYLTDLRNQFESYFDHELVSLHPNPNAIYRFYDEVIPGSSSNWDGL